MRAMLLHEHGPIAERPLHLVEIPDPVPAEREILVRVAACAACRTDLHVIRGEIPLRRLPIVPGHQIVGRVEKLGPGCVRFRPGDRVGIAWLRETCGTCEPCREGSENLCGRSRYTGYDADGGYAEKAVVREEFAYAIPHAFDDLHAAPLLCAGIIVYRALRRSAVREGGKLGLYGFGSSAHIVLQIARARGCEVHVATRGASHRDLARSMGASWVANVLDSPPVLLDSAIVFAPVGDLVPVALRAVRRGGTVALAGIHMSPVPAMDYERHLFHEKSLTSVEASTRRDGEDLLREATEIPIRPRITTFPLEQANDALAALDGDRIDGTAVLLLDEEQRLAGRT